MIEDEEQQQQEEQLLNPGSPTAIVDGPKKLALLPLVFLIYFEVAGGPYGAEPSVKAAGPLFAILGFLVFPFIWSIPEALITAELATTFPGNGGFVIWAHKAFGPFWGSLMGSWKFLSGVINLASYPVLCIEYLKLSPVPFHSIKRSGLMGFLLMLLKPLLGSGLRFGWNLVLFYQ
uniref:Amino acid permease/ SLC12A domain-containing protein n=1 Tax=Opuntia streptacantha TaxID=393608 RepID=A0A7C8ZX48_OPUST